MSALALQLIREAKEKRLTKLDLGNCGLTELPNELFELEWLEELNLGGWYYDFSAKEYLRSQNHGAYNSIKYISPDNLNFKSLNTLNLFHNQITDYSFLQKLTGLTSLDLRSNQITDIRFLQHLTGLTSLDLFGNKITDISFLQHLTGLTSLDLRRNQITDISLIRNLIEKGIPVKWENDYRGESIVLEENPLTTPPPEIVKKGNEAVLNYFRELDEQGSDYLYEAKLLVIGEVEAGKTTLVWKLKDEKAPMPEEKDTTRGMTIEPYFFKTADNRNFQINIWDFGGQEIYHATHQFFLTKRSLYVLVDNTRKDDKKQNDAGFDYWLQVTNLFGGSSPLLVVQNEKDDRTKMLDMKGMKASFDFVKDRFATNLLTGRGLKEVKEAIHYQIQRLPHVGEKLPKKWIAIRRELEDLSSTKDFIPRDDYLSICSKHGIEEERAWFLSSYLHDLGLFLHFRDNAVLKNIFILNNKWATDAVYKVLDNENIKRAFGHFNLKDLADIWSDARYKNRQDEFLALMTKFELCYELRDEDTWLAPQLLSEETPKIEWDEE